jgi:hypothetical protein
MATHCGTTLEALRECRDRQGQSIHAIGLALPGSVDGRFGCRSRAFPLFVGFCQSGKGMNGSMNPRRKHFSHV